METGYQSKERAGTTQLRASLLRILDKAIKAGGAAKGNVQVFDSRRGGLCIATQRGFDAAFLQLFHLVRIDDPSACARAFRHQRRVVVRNIAADKLYGPYLSIARANGYSAVQSTPIITEGDKAVGVFSTHFRENCHLSGETAKVLDRCAAQMARLIGEEDN